MNQITTNQAYSKLIALKTYLPEGITVHEKYVREFHEIVSLLERESDIDLSGFRVSPEELHLKAVSSNPLEGTVRHAEGNYCDRSFLLMKIEGVLGFFKLEASKAAIGFVPPQ